MIKLLSSISLVFSISLVACASAPVKPTPPKSTKAKPEAILAQNTYTPRKLSQAEAFQAWKKDFTARAIAKNYTPALVHSVIDGTKINPKAIERNKTQPEFSKPIWSYVDTAASSVRVNNGKTMLAEHAALFDQIGSRYPVDRHILTAIWGLESAYGQIMGGHNIINSLATFAFQGRRQKFGERELFAVLDVLANQSVRKEQLTGSWAGAMGMTQFIPSTFRDYGVDFHNDGNKDLWASEGDALGSAAHYLSRHGWRIEEPVFTEVILPTGFDYSLSNGTKRTISGWAALGIRDIGGKNWSRDAMFLEAKLLSPAGKNGPVFLTFKNFDVIKKYNNSTSYALGITVLAKALEGQTAIRRDWPRDDKPLTLTDKKNLQIALTRQGFNTKGVDGQIGPNSRRAIRAWQKANGHPADGYVEKVLLAKILGQ